MDHISFTYDVAGRKTGITYPNGSTASYVYNSTTGDLMGIDHIHNSTSFESLAYTYDAGGLVNSLDRAGVDPLMPGFLNASFDAANRHSWAEGISRPVYDRNGNMTAWGDMTLSWDQKNRLTGVTGAPGGTVTYSYDALNRRVSKTVAGTETKYLYDGLNMVAGLDGDGVVSAWYVHGRHLRG
jgi:YD repeat-containing protein